MTLSTERVFLSDAGAQFVCSAKNDFGSEEVLHILSVTGMQTALTYVLIVVLFVSISIHDEKKKFFQFFFK